MIRIVCWIKGHDLGVLDETWFCQRCRTILSEGRAQVTVSAQSEGCGCPGRHCVHRCVPDGAGGCSL